MSCLNGLYKKSHNNSKEHQNTLKLEIQVAEEYFFNNTSFSL